MVLLAGRTIAKKLKDQNNETAAKNLTQRLTALQSYVHSLIEEHNTDKNAVLPSILARLDKLTEYLGNLRSDYYDKLSNQ